MPVCADPLLFCASLIAALGCGSGGQSFDDGSGDLGRGKRSPVDSPERVTLSEQPSTLIRSPFSPGAGSFDPSSGFVGDLDSDGYADFALLAWAGTGPDWDPEQQFAYVFYGRDQFPAQLEPADADFVIGGVQGKLTRIGDFNGDGFDDFGFMGEGWLGTKYRFDLLLGGAERRSGTFSARTLETSFGGGPLQDLSYAAGPGDVNGDGYADLLLDSGLILGRAQPYGQTSIAGSGIVAASLDGGIADGPSAGDLDGDGFADLLLDLQDPQSYERTTRLLYGRADWGPSGEPLAPDAVFPGRVRSLGDWNGDGHGDLARVQNVPTWADADHSLLTALRHDVNVIYGGAGRFTGNITLPPESEEQLTPDQLALGDVNGDSRADLILGAPLSPRAQRQGAGAVFLLAHTDSSRPDELRLEERDAALLGESDSDGIGDLLGRGVSSGGDVNGDGYADVLVVQESYRDSLGARLIFGGQGL
jgi:hypothetical protein